MSEKLLCRSTARQSASSSPNENPLADKNPSQAIEEIPTSRGNSVKNAFRQGTLVPLVGSAIAGAAIITPVLVVLWRSFTTGKLGFNVGLNVVNYVRVFNDRDLWPMLGNSLVYAGGSALLGTSIGAMLAWIVARTNTPGKALVELMPLYPLLMPPIMKNIAWVLLLAPRSGILNGMLQQFLGIETPVFNAFTMLGMIWVFGIACVPLGYLF